MATLGWSVRGMGGALLVALLLSAGPARADDAAIPEEAKAYFKNGVELIQSQPPLPGMPGMYKQIRVAWADLEQGGYGTVKPKNMEHVFNIEFGTKAKADFDIMIDQVEFY